MEINSSLKPLYANLKRLKIGKYLYTKEFDLFMLESNLDEYWNECKDEVNRQSSVAILGYHNTEDEELAFIYFLSTWYNQYYSSFHEFILPVLLNFAIWHSTKIDFTPIVENLKTLKVSRENILQFTKDFRKIQENKPNKIEEVKLNATSAKKLTTHPNKVFVVHGHDDKSRLELCNLLKDEFKLEPIVLQESPNNSIETIIKKFERLASDCSMAIVLFTPDDEAGANKRARQNVIFELGYFLGKFQDEKDRKIIILKKGDLEIPSDISGVLYLEYNKAVKEIYIDLKNQLKHWGYKV